MQHSKVSNQVSLNEKKSTFLLQKLVLILKLYTYLLILNLHAAKI